MGNKVNYWFTIFTRNFNENCLIATHKGSRGYAIFLFFCFRVRENKKVWNQYLKETRKKLVKKIPDRIGVGVIGKVS